MDMKMTVHREFVLEKKINLNGEEAMLTIPKGEDADPYVGEDFLFVADGMGGRAPTRHKEFNADLFYRDKVYSALFGEKNANDEELRAYVEHSFRGLQLFVEKFGDAAFEQYKSSSGYMMKSAYFGSRILPALFWMKMKEEPFAGKTVFDEITKREGEERKAYLEALAATFTKEIYGDFYDVTKNTGFVYESKFRGLALLGTTLCGVLFREEQDYVDALFFVAGDSRPYAWDEKNGLRQAVEDQENEDGSMTTFLSVELNEPRENLPETFAITCRYHRFEKPCMILCASDGVFDSKLFDISSLSLEKLLLETIKEEEDLTKAGEALSHLFDIDNNGAHDDSSTMALRAFGYEDHAALVNAATKRLATIKADYLDKMKDLLDTRYAGEEEEALRREISLAVGLDAMKETMGLENDPAEPQKAAVAKYKEACDKVWSALDKSQNPAWMEEKLTFLLEKMTAEKVIAALGEVVRLDDVIGDWRKNIAVAEETLASAVKSASAWREAVAKQGANASDEAKAEYAEKLAAAEAAEREAEKYAIAIPRLLIGDLLAGDVKKQKKWNERMTGLCAAFSAEDCYLRARDFVKREKLIDMTMKLDAVHPFYKKAEELEANVIEGMRPAFADLVTEICGGEHEVAEAIREKAKTYQKKYAEGADKAHRQQDLLAQYDKGYYSLIAE